MLPASGGPRSSTVCRDSGRRLSEERLQRLRAMPRRSRTLGRRRRPREPRHGRLRGAERGVGLGLRARGRGAPRRLSRGRGGLLLRLHLDAPPEAAAVLETHPGRGEIAQHGRRLPDHDLLARDEVAPHLPGDAHDLGLDVGADAARLPHRDAVLRESDLPFDLAEDREVLAAGHVADDGDRRADDGLFPAFAGGGRRRGRLRSGDGTDGFVVTLVPHWISLPERCAPTERAHGKPFPPGSMCAVSLGRASVPRAVRRPSVRSRGRRPRPRSRPAGRAGRNGRRPSSSGRGCGRGRRAGGRRGCPDVSGVGGR